MSDAARVDLLIDQNTDWAIQLYWTNYSNTPYTVLSPMRMEIRSSTGAVAAELLTEEPLPEGTFPTISYNSESGLIQLQLTAESTNAMAAGEYLYDLYVTYQDKLTVSSTRLAKLLYGSVTVRGKVTQVV